MHEIIVDTPAQDHELDVVLISGDAYVDHPSFGPAVIARWLQAHGFTVGIITQPDWHNPQSVTWCGRPRLFFGITAGNLDSMLAHYTAFKKHRSDDAYTPGGCAGKRPDRATIVYANLVRRSYGSVPIVLGGIEASLRKLVHYDYWDDRLRESVLVDAGADLLVYGMGELTILAIASALRDGTPLENMTALPGTAVRVKTLPAAAHRLPSWTEFEHDRHALVRATETTLAHQHGRFGEIPLAQPIRSGAYVLVNPPQRPLTAPELDAVYELPYSRRPHPGYREKIPGHDVTAFSVVSHRGCGGACNFCTLALHQGRRITSRTSASVLREVRALTRHTTFKGTIADVGGPTANAYGYTCARDYPADCLRASCLAPALCRHFRAPGDGLVGLLRTLRREPMVKNVFISSGIRHDLLLTNRPLFEEIVRHHVGGHLKVAPEHTCDDVLAVMGKGRFTCFEHFLEEFQRLSHKAHAEQYLVPYFISGHPGCTPEHMRQLAGYLKKRNWKTRQVQAFIPLPGTPAAAYYWAETDHNGKKLHVAKDLDEKRRQFNELLWHSGPTVHRKYPRKKGRPGSSRK
jgi:uncharacterized radical SAM protein YgiQ